MQKIIDYFKKLNLKIILPILHFFVNFLQIFFCSLYIIFFSNVCLFSMLNIRLVNELPFWQPGDWLEGVVSLDLREPRSVTGVRLALKAKEDTHWSESKGKNDVHEYHSKVQWINTVLTLWGFPFHSTHKKELPAGRYVWPFRIAIPDSEELPASLEVLACGYVRYSLEAFVEVSALFAKDIKFKRFLPFAPLVTLERRRHLFTPEEFNEFRVVSNWYCGENGTINMTARCSTRGFVPGDTIPIDVRLVNNSGAKVTRVRAKLIEIIDLDAYNHHVHHKQCTNKVARTEVRPHIRPHSGPHTVQLQLEVPQSPIAPTFTSTYIRRAYRVKVRAGVSELFTRDIQVDFDVVGGTTHESNNPPLDSVPSLFNPNGAVRRKVILPTNDAEKVAPVCVDGLDYNPMDQSDLEHCVRYPTFYSADFSLPDTLMQYNQQLYDFLII